MRSGSSCPRRDLQRSCRYANWSATSIVATPTVHVAASRALQWLCRYTHARHRATALPPFQLRKRQPDVSVHVATCIMQRHALLFVVERPAPCYASGNSWLGLICCARVAIRRDPPPVVALPNGPATRSVACVSAVASLQEMRSAANAIFSCFATTSSYYALNELVDERDVERSCRQTNNSVTCGRRFQHCNCKTYILRT